MTHLNPAPSPGLRARHDRHEPCPPSRCVRLPRGACRALPRCVQHTSRRPRVAACFKQTYTRPSPSAKRPRPGSPDLSPAARLRLVLTCAYTALAKAMRSPMRKALAGLDLSARGSSGNRLRSLPRNALASYSMSAISVSATIRPPTGPSRKNRAATFRRTRAVQADPVRRAGQPQGSALRSQRVPGYGLGRSARS